MTPGADAGALPVIMIQARVGSTRLPRKVLADLAGEPVLSWVVRRCLQSRLGGGVAVLTTDLEKDDPVAALGAALGVLVYRGSEPDVLLRYVQAAQHLGASLVVRVTADCPFIDPAVIDEVIALYRRDPADYVCLSGYPEGLGAAELVRRSALETALADTTPSDTGYREHVITYLTDHPHLFQVRAQPASSHRHPDGLRFSIDTPRDLARARAIARYFHPSRAFGVDDILTWWNATEARAR